MISSFLKLKQLVKMKANKLITKRLSKFILIIQILLFSSIGIVTEPFFSNMTKDKILPADEAFLFKAYLQNEESIILTWAMKENCFLYKDKFKIYTDNTNISIRETNGEAKRINDIYFGDVDVYFNSVSKKINLDQEVEFINISYQGCNEKGFCYPLINKKIEVEKLDNL